MLFGLRSLRACFMHAVIYTYRYCLNLMIGDWNLTDALLFFSLRMHTHALPRVCVYMCRRQVGTCASVDVCECLCMHAWSTMYATVCIIMFYRQLHMCVCMHASICHQNTLIIKGW